jgi:hypothetical protein
MLLSPDGIHKAISHQPSSSESAAASSGADRIGSLIHRLLPLVSINLPQKLMSWATLHLK